MLCSKLRTYVCALTLSYPYSTLTYRRSALISTVHCQNSLLAPTGNEFAVWRFFFVGIFFLLDHFNNSPIILIAINFNSIEMCTKWSKFKYRSARFQRQHYCWYGEPNEKTTTTPLSVSGLVSVSFTKWGAFHGGEAASLPEIKTPRST